MIRCRCLLRHEALRGFAPGLPPALTIAQCPESVLAIEERLLQRFVGIGRNDRRCARVSLSVQYRGQQARPRPGLVRSVPLDPGQATAVGAGARRRIEIRALGQHLALAARAQGDQAMPRRLFAAVFLDRQHPLPDAIPMQVAVAPAFTARQAFGGAAVPGLAIDRLIPFVDEQRSLVRQAQGATAVFIHLAAQAEAGWREAPRCGTGCAQPQPGGAIGRVVLAPVEATGVDLEFGEVDAGGNGLGRRERGRGGHGDSRSRNSC